jgi:hypothetical protein
MTSEELEQDLKEVNDRLTEFAEREEKLTNKEWRLQQRLLKEKQLLERIKQARVTQNNIQEIKLMTEYSVLKAASTQHPIINYLMQIKIRSNIWG